MKQIRSTHHYSNHNYNSCNHTVIQLHIMKMRSKHSISLPHLFEAEMLEQIHALMILAKLVSSHSCSILQYTYFCVAPFGANRTGGVSCSWNTGYAENVQPTQMFVLLPGCYS